MNVFEFFTKLTHPSKRLGWAETTAYFTGKKRLCRRGRFAIGYDICQVIQGMSRPVLATSNVYISIFKPLI